jgi:hypothetical protein
MGRDGIEMGLKLGTDDAVRLARQADDIARLAPAPRSQVLSKLGRNAKGVLSYLEAHPKILLTAAGVAAVLAVEDNFLGEAGERRVLPDGTVIEPSAGFAERITQRLRSLPRAGRACRSSSTWPTRPSRTWPGCR